MRGEAGGVCVVLCDPTWPGGVEHLDVNQGVGPRPVEIDEDEVRTVPKRREAEHEVLDLARGRPLSEDTVGAEDTLAEIDELVARGIMDSSMEAETMGAADKVAATDGDGRIAATGGAHAAMHAPKLRRADEEV